LPDGNLCIISDADQSSVFPGGYIPSFSFVVQTLNEGSAGRLIIDSVLNIGPHYARTLREWKRRFLANWDGLVAKALVNQYNLDAKGLEIFKRKWICACPHPFLLTAHTYSPNPQTTCKLN
jgi:cyclopropane-fatty-acyl-phospholipid synthase